ncbi:hypothetical protein FQN57_005064 [Myotisia sp. PD_48]|nr:hypothetical protein FQN57_005064 [Myotisia sp. PD_48]
MPILNSPFGTSTFLTRSGYGEVVLTVLPPSSPSLSTLSYNYPLKFLSRLPACELDSKYPLHASNPLHLYLLTYGGGLLPGDHIDVSITLQPRGRLVLTTPQGSTKIFKTEAQSGRKRQPNMSNQEATEGSDMSRQNINVQLERGTGLCYLPDPSVPFADSKYEQFQRFTILQDGKKKHSLSRDPIINDSVPLKGDKPSLCVLDWVTEGRSARGEKWSFHSWRGRNEVWLKDVESGKKRLLLRDTVILDDKHSRGQQQSGIHQNALNPFTSIISRSNPHGILGTLILHGPLYESLASFFMEIFAAHPRIGGQNWGTASELSVFYPHGTGVKSKGTTDTINNGDEDMNNSIFYPENVTWTAAKIRNNFVLVKFGANDFECAKLWLGNMFRREGSIVKEFGEEALDGF